MHYPAFIKPGDTIGIPAPSAGVGHKLEHFDRALAYLKKAGFSTQETASVRYNGIVSTDAATRARELESCFLDDKIKAIITAAGGDFLMEMLPELDFSILLQHPKWLMGMSDPSTLLFILPVCYDMATLYGNNIGGFDQNPELRSQKDALAFLRGEYPVQENYAWYYVGKGAEDLPKEDVYWQTPNGAVDIQGRLIGGCIDALRDIIGTPYDRVKDFTNCYEKDGIVWFFDNYALKAEDFYHCLWQMKQAGWFHHTRGVVLGRTLFPGTWIDMTYTEALQRIFGTSCPLILEADIGHTTPGFTLVNGGYVHMKAKDGKGCIRFLEK